MTAPTQSNKTKSPATPSYALKDVYADVKKLYDKFSHASFSRAEIASTLSMSSASGAFAQKVFSLTEFGLLDKSGDKYAVAKPFHSLEPVDVKRPDFQKAALDAIRRSDVFAEILADFKTKWPGELVVAQRLERERGFNAARAKDVAGILQRSLDFAGVIDANNNIVPVRELSAVQAELSGTGRSSVAEPDGGAPNLSRIKGLRSSEIPLGEGRVAVVQYPHDLTSTEASKIGKVLGALVE
jgi:hypothetical protein